MVRLGGRPNRIPADQAMALDREALHEGALLAGIALAVVVVVLLFLLFVGVSP